VGLKNLFTRTIEWNKHQGPETWEALLAEQCFRKQALDWTSFNAFGAPGRLLIGNRLAAYCTISHIRLVMRKPRRLALLPQSLENAVVAR
jgi:uncharacterized membrane-anchored protein